MLEDRSAPSGGPPMHGQGFFDNGQGQGHASAKVHFVCVQPLPPSWTEADLRQHFSGYGQVLEASLERRIISHPGLATSRSGEVRCVGIVGFGTPAAAHEALRNEHGAPSPTGMGVIYATTGAERRVIGNVEGTVRVYLR